MLSPIHRTAREIFMIDFFRRSRPIAAGAAAFVLLFLACQSSAQAPAFTSPTHAEFTVGVESTFVITTTGSPAPVITRSAGGLPPGVVLTDRGDGTATLAGTPEPLTAGAAPVTVTATNSAGTATQTLNLLVREAPTVYTADYATFVVGMPSTFRIEAFGVPTPAVTVTGALPPGLTLTPDGSWGFNLAGTPTTAGAYPLTVRATSSLGTATQALTVTVLAATPTSADRNYSGMYYNPQSSGYAVNLTHQGNTIVVAWYAYAQDERPIWYVAATSRQGDGSFSGGYSVFTGVPFAQIDNAPSALTNQNAGDVKLSFRPDGKLDFRFTPVGENRFQQRRTLSRLVFDPAPPTCRFTHDARSAATNYSDLWYWQEESGWGLTVEHQGNLIYIAWYTYADDGKPMWMASLLSRQEDGSYAGIINRPNRGVWSYYDTFGPATTFPLPEVGTSTLRFLDGEHAVFGYTVGSVTQLKAIRRIVFGTPRQICSNAAP
jgi:hypothetical protein